MRNARTVFLLLGAATAVVVSAVGAYLAVFGRDLVAGSTTAAVKPVPEGCHEIAWFGPATSAETWERIVGAAEQMKKQWPPPGTALKPLQLDLTGAFPQLTAGVPEIVLWVEGQEEHKLYLRWYKISSESPTRTWIENLSQRSPPLAILGGETTFRAAEISERLKDYRDNDRWNGPAPVFLISTATADAYAPRGGKAPSKELMDIYQGRNYRFSFTNTLMAQSVLAFVQENPQLLWPPRPTDPHSAANLVALGNPWSAAVLVQAEPFLANYALYGVAWLDDEYSKDLCHGFEKVFHERFYPAGTAVPDPEGKELIKQRLDRGFVDFSTGDQFQPGSRDVSSAMLFHNERDKAKWIRQLLALPTGADRARRFLRALVSSAPGSVRNIVALSGDSITFNNVFRDRKLAWNVQDVPVPLVFFSHRNPIDRDAGFRPEVTPADPPWATTGTQDLLFYRDLMEAVTLAAYRNNQFVADADELNQRLGQLRWHQQPAPAADLHPPGGRITYDDGRLLFDDHHNRRVGTGEHVVLVLPQRYGDVVEPDATMSVWWRQTGREYPRRWQKVGEDLKVSYLDTSGD